MTDQSQCAMMLCLLSYITVLLLIVQPTKSQSQSIRWGIHNCRELETKCLSYYLGSKGYAGIPGPPGLPGEQGIPGPPGQKGPKGFSAIGEPRPMLGPKGFKGDSGLKGAKGFRGLQGLKGEKGDFSYGITGYPGSKGERGYPGLSGPKGFPGSGEMVLGWKSCSWILDPLQEYGLAKECIFNKIRSDSVLHVVYEGSMRAGFCLTCCKRWYFTFDNNECNQGRIEAKLTGQKLFSGPSYRHGRIDGYCAVAAGRVSVALWVEDCPGHQRARKGSITKLNTTSRITIEEIEIS